MGLKKNMVDALVSTVLRLRNGNTKKKDAPLNC